MKQYALFPVLLLLLFSQFLTAQQPRDLSEALQSTEDVLRAFLRSRNISNEEAEFYINQNKKNKSQVVPSVGYSGKAQDLSIAAKGGHNTLLDSSGSCNNLDFESSAVGTYTSINSISGWQLLHRTVNVCNTTTLWSPGSPEFSIVTTPLFEPGIGTLPHSPLGGTKIARLNNNSPSMLHTMLTRSILVTKQNYKVIYAFAAVLNDGSHLCCEQPCLKVRVNNSSCGEIIKGTPGSNCTSPLPSGFTYTTNYLYVTNWQVDTLNLLPYIGLQVDVSFTSADCIYGGHYASMFLDVACQNATSPCEETSYPCNDCISFCPGSTIAVIHGIPNTGFSSYNWYSPNGTLTAQQSTSSVLTITNPVAGSVYSLYIGVPGACSGVMIKYKLDPTQTSVKCIDTSPSCQSNASGSATIIARGSGTGYQYTWSSATQTTWGNNSVITGLGPGTYTLSVSALNQATCGTASTVFTIGSFNGGAPSLTISPSSAHICAGQQISLVAQGGATSYTWAGGGNSSILVATPLTTTNYFLTAGTPGLPCTSTVAALVKVSSVKLNVTPTNTFICPGDTVMLSASGAQNYYWAGSGITVPNYSVALMSSKIYTVTGSSLFSGLTCTDVATIVVNVRQAPYVLVSGSPRICIGEHSVYTGIGAVNFTWNNGQTGPTSSFTTAAAGLYSVCASGIDSAGCKGNYCLGVKVLECVGIAEQDADDGFQVYPNPSGGDFTVRMNVKSDLIIYNELMQVVYQRLKADDNSQEISVRLAAGIYYVVTGYYPAVKVIVE